MKSRNTIILLVLCVGLIAYIQFFHKKQLTTDEREQRRTKPVQIERDKVEAITLRNADGTFEFKQREGNWYLEAPVKDRAESISVTGLLTSAETINWAPVEGAPKDALKDYGLAKGEMSVTFTGKPGIDQFNPERTSVELLMGKDAAVEGRVYYRIEGSDTPYTGLKELRDQVAKGVKDWRSRTLSDLTPALVNKLHLKTAKGELELEKQGLNWSFTKPFKARGDNQKITDLISNATTPRIEEFLPESQDLGAYGLNEPRATLTFFAEGQAEPVVLKIGAAKQDKPAEKPEEKKEGAPDAAEPPTPPAPPTHVYVKLSTREGVFTVPAAIESLINTQPNDLRDQSLMRVQPDIVDRITIESPKGKIVLGRAGEEWVRKHEGKEDEPINSAAASKLLNVLVNAKVTRLVADFSSDLKGFGLDQPTATITLSSYSTEGTPETNPGEKPIVKLILGRFEGDAGYAKLEDEPFIVSVPSSMQEEIWTDPIQWQDLRIIDLNRESITQLEVARANQPPLTLVLEKDKSWKPATGTATVNQTNVQSLINTLSALRAVRWIGATDPAAHGMDKPSLVVTATTADKGAAKITVGTVGPDQMWHATASGKTGTFLITQGDFDALNAALTNEQQAATATPAPAPGTPGTPPAATTEPVTVTTPPVSVPPAVPEPAAPPAPAPAPAPAPEPGTVPPPAPPAPEPGETPAPAEAPKPTEVPSSSAKPAPEPAPKAE